ncbi:FecR family protein [Chitinophaga skermanii]|uniref:FecR family protein n=1 Tax=Chitinophaga skermanii TaxID=331697 RepID=A0A327QYZ8_9BACT|nr:FecR family protein [Chitinophaga skermanii]RAJ08852.1 FecR family protein [Chitinophaga skermanii]
MPTSSNHNGDSFETSAYIAELLLRRVQGVITEEETAELEAWLQTQPPASRDFYTDACTMPQLEAGLQTMHKFDETAALDDVWKRIGMLETRTVPVRRLWLRWTAAAALLAFVVSTSIIFFNHKQNTTPGVSTVARYGGDALPAGNKATLELADGSVIDLNSTKKGKIDQFQDANIFKQDDETISYENTLAQSEADVTYHKIITPRGGKFDVVLPDGTKVWLNAASSLKYPTAFIGKERVVELSGEAYFDVAKNAQQPFTVRTIDTKREPLEVRVLGTAFNIQAYSDEPLRTATLVNGKVSVQNKNDREILLPGQQAMVHNRQPMQVQVANIESVLAWKNGLFIYHDASIQEIMREISRVYDVDVVFDGDIAQQFEGTIPRSMKLSDVLKILESTGWVQFSIVGKTVTVKPL